MEVPSTMNRRGTVTAVDIAIPNVGGEDNGGTGTNHNQGPIV